MKPRYATVCFDVDSTLVSIEGIDVLAGDHPEIAQLTEAAMNGEIPIDQVYRRRLEIIEPSLTEIRALGRRYVDSLLPGAESLIARLRADHVTVRLVTGGIEQAVLPLAERLQISPTFVHAVPLQFDEDGIYRGFDMAAPTARPLGKAVVVRNIRSRNKGSIAFVGDGVTDLDTLSVVDAFIGFGGVVAREAVRQRAAHFVKSFTELATLLYEDDHE